MLTYVAVIIPAIVLGLFTRLGAFVNLIVQVTALLVVHIPQGFFIASEKVALTLATSKSGSGYAGIINLGVQVG